MAGDSSGAAPDPTIDDFLRAVARAPAVSIPETIGRYRILSRLGAGGMGVVYAAHDPKLDRPVAIKVLHERAGDRAHLEERLHREAQALARVTHANVVSVFDVGVDDGVVHVVMQRITGTTLDRALAARPHTPAEVLAMLAAAGRGLAAAHAVGLVHRDFKPSNVLVDADGQPRITDFGLAMLSQVPDPHARPVSDAGAAPPNLTQTGAILGTPAYMAPEQFLGGRVDAASDQFSFCVVLWEALGGRRPFGGDSHDAIFAAVTGGAIEPPPLRLDRRIEQALRRGLSVDPAARFADMEALLAALPPPRRRRWWIAGAIAGGAVAVATIAIVTGGGDGRATASAPTDATPPPAPRPQVTPENLTHLGGCADNPAFLDEETLVFQLGQSDASQIYRLDLRDGTAAPLGAEPVMGMRPQRGATADEVLYERERRLEAIELGSGHRRVVANGRAVAFARGGYYHSLGSALARAEGTDDAAVLQLPDGKGIVMLAASGRGDQLAASVFDGHAPPQLCTVALDEPVLRCSNAATMGGRAAFSTDGDAVYFGRLHDIQRLTIADGTIEPVLADTTGSGSLAVSPSGRALVFSRCEASFQLAWDVQDATHGAFAPGPVSAPAFGLAGRYAYVRTDDEGDTLVLHDAEGPNRDIMTIRGWITSMSFSPDGRLITYVRGGGADAGIHVVATDGITASNRLTEDAGDDHPFFAGGGVVFTRWQADGQPRLMRVELDGSGEQVASTRPRITIGADLARDRVLVASPARDYLYWWSPADGSERPGPTVSGTELGGLVLAPSGRWLVSVTGTTVYRRKLDERGGGEEFDELPVPADVTDVTAAIDDDGHVLLTTVIWKGELAIARAPASTPW